MATKYIGGKYTPGEIVGDDLTEEQLKWLTQVGAVKEIAPPAGTAPGEAVEPGTEADDEAQMQVGEAETEEAEEPDEEAEEPDEEADSPEVDVMSGIVSAPPTEEPKKRSASRKGGKK